MALHDRDLVNSQTQPLIFSTDARALGEGSRPGVNAETLKRADCCHWAAAPEDYCFAEW